MLARFGGTCACGCRKPFAAGEQLVRAPAGWARAACVAPRGAPSGSAEEILEILARAKVVAARTARAQPPRAAGRVG